MDLLSMLLNQLPGEYSQFHIALVASVQPTDLAFRGLMVDNGFMIWVDITELADTKPALSSYIQRVEAGEILVILRNGKPVAEIKPATMKTPSQRPFGLCAAEFVVPDDFDEPLPDDILATFEAR
jgi:antitoxin (DNA-binding transcriptional repressor) of toxin-antitoxin stability system